MDMKVEFPKTKLTNEKVLMLIKNEYLKEKP